MPQFELLHLAKMYLKTLFATQAKVDGKILYRVSMATLYTSVILWLLSNNNRYLALSCILVYILYIVSQYIALHKCANLNSVC